LQYLCYTVAEKFEISLEVLFMFGFGKSNVKASMDQPDTVIGKGVYLESARMTGQENVRIAGIFKGTIEIEGSVVLEDSGCITGDVHANYFLVAGEMNGNINCSTQLHFASTAKVVGDVKTNSLIADEGSQVDGRYVVGADRLGPKNIGTSADRLRLMDGDDD